MCVVFDVVVEVREGAALVAVDGERHWHCAEHVRDLVDDRQRLTSRSDGRGSGGELEAEYEMTQFHFAPMEGGRLYRRRH